MKTKDVVYYLLLAAFAGLLIFLIPYIFLVVPTAQESAGGIAQKIFYFHAPIAMGLYVTGTFCFIGSAAYLLKPSEGANAWARAGAECAAYHGALVLVSGPLWAKQAWGVYWVWDPQLTTLLLGVLIYIAIVLLRAFGGDGSSERRFAAALGVMGTFNLPIIYISVTKWGGNHPNVTREGGGGLGDPSMKVAFRLGMLALTLLLPIIMVWLRARLTRLQSTVNQAWEDALARGLVDWEGTEEEDAEPK